MYYAIAAFFKANNIYLQQSAFNLNDSQSVHSICVGFDS